MMEKLFSPVQAITLAMDLQAGWAQRLESQTSDWAVSSAHDELACSGGELGCSGDATHPASEQAEDGSQEANTLTLIPVHIFSN